MHKLNILIIALSCLASICAAQIAPVPASFSCNQLILEEDFNATMPAGWTGDFGMITPFREQWILDFLATPTAGTGPDAAFSGNYYIYMETNGPASANATFSIITNNITLTGYKPTLTFYLLMYGSQIGEFKTFIISKSGTQRDEVLAVTGQQHGSSTDWEQVYIDLSSYTNETIQIEFMGMKGMLATDVLGDIAIDLIQVCNSPPPAPIPTLGQWGILNLLLSLMIVAIVGIKSKQPSIVVETKG